MLRLFGAVPLGDAVVDVGVGDEPFLLQELEGAIHRGDVDLGEAGVYELVNVVHCDVARDRLQGVKNDLALEREAVAAFTESGA